MSEYATKVDELLNQLAEIHGEDEYGMFTGFIPDHHWSATIIHAYAAFEQKLNEACEIAKQSLDLKLRYKKFAGQGISRAKLYLELYAELDLSVSRDQWRHVESIAKLRNVLVHGGLTDEHPDFKFLSQYAKETGAFQVSDSGLSLGLQSVQHTLKKLGEPLCNIGDCILSLKNANGIIPKKSNF